FTSFPLVNPIQSQFQGRNDAFVATLNATGSGLLFSTYLGGSGSYGAGALGFARDSTGNTYVTGATSSSDFPTTPGAYQTTFAAGSYEGFVTKLNPASPLFAVTGFASPTTAGTAGAFTVPHLNADGSVNSGYPGTVHFTSSAPQAVLPGDYTFTAADQGSHTFSATLKTVGLRALFAIDTATPTTNGGQISIQVNPAAATHFVLSGSSNLTAGTAFSLTVTAVDAYGNIATGYRGTVHFTDSVSRATLPHDYTFTATDAGVHTFTGVRLRTRGIQMIKVVDTLTDSILGTLTITVN